LAYRHIPPGTPEKDHADRMRPWVGESPYLKNRTPRGPKGRDRLLPIHKPINYANIPALKSVVVHSHVANAADNSGWLHVASMAIQSITNVRLETHKSKVNVAEWEARANKFVSLTARLEGEDMYHFLAKTIELVLPRLKDWKGVSGSSGDLTGNITFGLTPEQFALYPEIQFNYGHYPPSMLPGCHITMHTTAKTTKEGRLLLMALGIPFDGEIRKR
jgi:large subunit ribosomal protein L5